MESVTFKSKIDNSIGFARKCNLPKLKVTAYVIKANDKLKGQYWLKTKIFRNF